MIKGIHKPFHKDGTNSGNTGNFTSWQKKRAMN